MAMVGGFHEQARAHFESAIAVLDEAGATHASARLSARLGEIDFLEDRLEQGTERMERAFSLLAGEEPDVDLTALAAQLGRLHLFIGTYGLAAERLEFALGLAEKLHVPEQLTQALNSKAVLMDFLNRHEEAMALVTHALKIALENDRYTAATAPTTILGRFWSTRTDTRRLWRKSARRWNSPDATVIATSNCSCSLARLGC